MNLRKLERGDDTAIAYTRLLDETILHLAALEWSKGIGPMHAWRARCVALLAGFDEDLQSLSLGLAQARRLKVSHALLLDDVTVTVCCGASGNEWLAATLCRVELAEPDALELVRTDLEALILDPSASVARLHWYRCLLAAGLMGRTPEAAARKRTLDARLVAAWPAASRNLGAS